MSFENLLDSVMFNVSIDNSRIPSIIQASSPEHVYNTLEKLLQKNESKISSFEKKRKKQYNVPNLKLKNVLTNIVVGTKQCNSKQPSKSNLDVLKHIKHSNQPTQIKIQQKDVQKEKQTVRLQLKENRFNKQSEPQSLTYVSSPNIRMQTEPQIEYQDQSIHIVDNGYTQNRKSSISVDNLQDNTKVFIYIYIGFIIKKEILSSIFTSSEKMTNVDQNSNRRVTPFLKVSNLNPECQACLKSSFYVQKLKEQIDYYIVELKNQQSINKSLQQNQLELQTFKGSKDIILLKEQIKVCSLESQIHLQNQEKHYKEVGNEQQRKIAELQEQCRNSNEQIQYLSGSLVKYNYIQQQMESLEKTIKEVSSENIQLKEKFKYEEQQVKILVQQNLLLQEKQQNLKLIFEELKQTTNMASNLITELTSFKIEPSLQVLTSLIMKKNITTQTQQEQSNIAHDLNGLQKLQVQNLEFVNELSYHISSTLKESKQTIVSCQSIFLQKMFQ